MENIATQLEISASELSKILNGKRTNYGTSVYPLSEILGVNYLEVTKPNRFAQYNYGENKQKGVENAATVNNTSHETLKLYVEKCNEVANGREKLTEKLFSGLGLLAFCDFIVHFSI